ncbi:hypothetical protein M407DRAFT_241097 [Tulasnella calospora MUT 4182]|uniref:Uncharacterized protein n=1 Tax=Tulasnella calospora MUT 4182 TaxID=1051891 RepID=A0A0C3LH35_9AGAM|nr:hypothetical protein M407DRAFT_241097 [Tulasnella calospora MUT 4182]
MASPSVQFYFDRSPRRMTSSLVLLPGDDPAKPFVDMIVPALDKLETTKPTLPSLTESDCTLDGARDSLVPNLDDWVKWAGHLEEFVWDFGEQLLGADYWIPTTDAVQDLKRDIRSLCDGIKNKNVEYLRKHDFITPSSDPPTLQAESITKLLDNEDVRTLMDWSRVRTNEVTASTAIVPLAIPISDSPEPTSAIMSSATVPGDDWRRFP